MDKKLIIFGGISLLVGAVTYLALDNYIYALIVFTFYIVVSIFLFNPVLKKYDKIVLKYHECYHFVNNFAISLSIKKSIKGALESTVNSMPQSFVDIYEGLDNMTDHEKINYLSTYFTFHVYRLFIQIVNLWEEEGGDILKMSKYLISEVRHNEEYISKADTLSKKKYTEIGVLWIFCLAIVVILRFALKDFYQMIKGQYIFIGAMLVLDVFILFSIYLLIQKGTKLDIRGYNDNEKII